MPVNTKPSHANKESSGEPEHSDETNTAKRKWQPAELKPRAQPEPHPVAPPDREDTSTEDTPSDSIPSQDLPAAEPTIRIHEQARPTPSPPPISRDHTKAEPTRRIPHISPEPSGSRPTRPPENYTAAKPTRRIPAAEPTRRIPPQEPAQPKDTSAWEPTQRIPILSQRGTPRTQPTQRPTRPTGDEPTVAVHRTPPPPPPSSPPSSPTQTLRAKAAEPRQRQGLSWAQVLLWLTASGVALFFLGLVAAVIGYIVVAAQLPSPEELRMREPKFASSQILDHDGHLLYEIVDPNTGKRTYVPISQISRYVQLATVATEDRNFYAHSGFDPIALARAIYYALQEREIVSGASTITQQVARNILMSAEERAERTAARKIKEIVLATELTRKYSKDEILEIYLNNNNYGNLAYGIDAAARTYFSTTAKDLTLSQATFLAGIPQAPAVYDPYHGGRDAALKRHKIVLGLMVEAGFITQEQADTAAAEMETHPFQPMYTDRIPAPHFVFYVRQWVETNLGADLLYQGSGLRIYTPLDPRLQGIA